MSTIIGLIGLALITASAFMVHTALGMFVMGIYFLISAGMAYGKHHKTHIRGALIEGRKLGQEDALAILHSMGKEDLAKEVESALEAKSKFHEKKQD